MKQEMHAIMNSVIETVKNENRDVPIRITGNSMFPLYRDGDIVFIHSCQDYQINDIVVVIRPEHFIVHRLINKMTSTSGEDYFLTKGDNNNYVDRWYPRKYILAKVVK